MLVNKMEHGYKYPTYGRLIEGVDNTFGKQGHRLDKASDYISFEILKTELFSKWIWKGKQEFFGMCLQYRQTSFTGKFLITIYCKVKDKWV